MCMCNEYVRPHLQLTDNGFSPRLSSMTSTGVPFKTQCPRCLLSVVFGEISVFRLAEPDYPHQ